MSTTMHDSLYGKTVLISGATGGIGLEFVKAFLELKCKVIAMGRDKNKLAMLESEFRADFASNIETIETDLSRPDELSGLKKIVESFGYVDILINNAGIGVVGHFAKTDLAREIEMINVNLTALTSITKFVLPKMLERKCGSVLNVCSTAAFNPGPQMSVYYATKAYVLSFSKALSYELRDTGVSVIALCPGPTGTKFITDANNTGKLLKIDLSKMAKPSDVVREGINALRKKRSVVIAGPENKLKVFLSRMLPERIVLRAIDKFRNSQFN